MNHAQTNRAPVVALFVPILIAAVAACSASGSSPSSVASSAPALAAATASPASSAPPTASPTASPTAHPTASPTARPTTSDTVKIGVRSSASLGSFLTGPNGKTLYTLSSDPTNKSTCAGECATAWPPLKIAPNGKVESAAMGTFGIIKRADGTDQVAFDGHPLYEFIRDTAPGQTNGEGIKAFGGTWHVAKAN